MKIHIILFSVCLLCHILRSLYEVLKLKNKISPENKIVFSFMLCNMILLWMSWSMMCEADPVSFHYCIFVKYFGLMLFIMGISLFIYTIFKMRALDNYKGELIQTGIFSKFRHPMYMGFILMVLGYPLFLEAKLAFFSSVIWILNILFWKFIEEKQLEKKYADYRKYKQKTIF
ncbi:MAG: DUF1295 domain-containing protein [Desulfobacteraceae bacterium]|nr:DUF1295 domain-containing protein [Desulfobacteraceae bacterium]